MSAPAKRYNLNVSLTGDNGAETVRHLEYQVPIGAEPGTLYFTVADAGTANIADFRQVLTATARTPGQLVSTVNNLHPNTKAYIRVWRADPAFQLEGADLPDPPASVSLILAGSQASSAGITQTRNSKIARNGNRSRRHGRHRFQDRSGGSKGMILSIRHFALHRSSLRARSPPPPSPAALRPGN